MLDLYEGSHISVSVAYFEWSTWALHEQCIQFLQDQVINLRGMSYTVPECVYLWS